jgi:hypothetical protein
MPVGAEGRRYRAGRVVLENDGGSRIKGKVARQQPKDHHGLGASGFTRRRDYEMP